jgi:hypothetical protein
VKVSLAAHVQVATRACRVTDGRGCAAGPHHTGDSQVVLQEMISIMYFLDIRSGGDPPGRTSSSSRLG